MVQSCQVFVNPYEEATEMVSGLLLLLLDSVPYPWNILLGFLKSSSILTIIPFRYHMI